MTDKFTISRGRGAAAARKGTKSWWEKYRQTKPSATFFCQRCGGEFSEDERHTVYSPDYEESMDFCEVCYDEL